MSTVILVVLGLNLAVLLLLVVRLDRVRRRNREVAAAVTEATAKVGAPVQLDPLFAPAKSRLITVEILNASELAATQNRFSGVAGGLAPDLIRKVVYDRAAAIMREQLAEQGVDAEVKIHVAV